MVNTLSGNALRRAASMQELLSVQLVNLQEPANVCYSLSLQVRGLKELPHEEQRASISRSCLPCLINVSSVLVTTCWVMPFTSFFLSSKGKTPEICCFLLS